MGLLKLFPARENRSNDTASIISEEKDQIVPIPSQNKREFIDPIMLPEDQRSLLQLPFGQFRSEYSSFLKKRNGGEYANTALTNELPKERIRQYYYFERAADIGLVNLIIETNVTFAVGFDEEREKECHIEAREKKYQPLIDELTNEVMPHFEGRLNHFGYEIFKNGIITPKIYLKKGKGFQGLEYNINHHPANIFIYERNGKEIGYLNTIALQQLNQSIRSQRKIELAHPHQYLTMRINGGMNKYEQKNQHIHQTINNPVFDINSVELKDIILPAQNYGTSLLNAAWDSIVKFNWAYSAMVTQRYNASMTELMTFLPQKGMDATEARIESNDILDLLKKRDEKIDEDYAQGIVRTQKKFFWPINNERGNVENVTLQTPAPTQIEDVRFAAQTLGASMGIDVSQLGYADLMSASLGNANSNHLSQRANNNAIQLRRGLTKGLSESFDLHILYKYGKVFPNSYKPWKINFSAYNQTIEQQKLENQQLEIQLANQVSETIQNIPRGDNLPEEIEYNAHEFLMMHLEKMNLGEGYKKVFKKRKVNTSTNQTPTPINQNELEELRNLNFKPEEL